MKTKNRIKTTPLPALQSRDDAEMAMNDLALVIANKNQRVAIRDAEVLKINEAHAVTLAKFDEAIASYTQQLQHWAESNPAQFPKDRKSLKMTSGTLGFRTGTRKLVLFSRAWNWEKVLKRLQEVATKFVRSKPEIDKDALLSDYASFVDKSAAAARLSNWGLKVTQDESFFIEPDLTYFENRQVNTTPAPSIH